MPLDDPVTLASLVTGAVAILGTIYTGAYKMGKLELKVDTIWDIFLKSATNEALKAGLLRRGSALKASQDKVNELLEGLITELRTKSELIKNLDPNEQVLAIERLWGERFQVIADKRGISYTALLVMVRVFLSSNS